MFFKRKLTNKFTNKFNAFLITFLNSDSFSVFLSKIIKCEVSNNKFIQIYTNMQISIHKTYIILC